MENTEYLFICQQVCCIICVYMYFFEKIFCSNLVLREYSDDVDFLVQIIKTSPRLSPLSLILTVDL